jgi:hypothetical protein
VVGLGLLCLTSSQVALPVKAGLQSKEEAFVRNVARDISELRRRYPQLSNFVPSKCADLGKLRIEYEFRTHRPERGGGWTAGVPNPDDDGIWFYIDVHDRNSMAQIHTQPITAPLCFDGKRVSFLILEGASTRRASGDIWKVLERNGAQRCRF